MNNHKNEVLKQKDNIKNVLIEIDINDYIEELKPYKLLSDDYLTLEDSLFLTEEKIQNDFLTDKINNIKNNILKIKKILLHNDRSIKIIKDRKKYYKEYYLKHKDYLLNKRKKYYYDNLIKERYNSKIRMEKLRSKIL